MNERPCISAVECERAGHNLRQHPLSMYCCLTRETERDFSQHQWRQHEQEPQTRARPAADVVVIIAKFSRVFSSRIKRVYVDVVSVCCFCFFFLFIACQGQLYVRSHLRNNKYTYANLYTYTHIHIHNAYPYVHTSLYVGWNSTQNVLYPIMYPWIFSSFPVLFENSYRFNVWICLIFRYCALCEASGSPSNRLLSQHLCYGLLNIDHLSPPNKKPNFEQFSKIKTITKFIQMKLKNKRKQIEKVWTKEATKNTRKNSESSWKKNLSVRVCEKWKKTPHIHFIPIEGNQVRIWLGVRACGRLCVSVR